jgi:hypothetical protein
MQLDNRYTVNPESCGCEKPQFVARFCMIWIGKAETKIQAESIAIEHRKNFLSSLSL